MFIRKLFKIGDKAKWLALELVIVFVGVYLAFLFSSYTEQQKVNAEREKILASLKKETELFKISFPLNANYQELKIKEWNDMYDQGETDNYYTWRYLEPQYSFQVIEYAINLQGTEIIDFELYESLLSLDQEIKQLVQSERMMTELGNKYNFLPSGLSEDSDIYKMMKAQNLFHFWKFTFFASDRVQNLREVVKLTEKVLPLIDQRLSQQKQEQVVVEILRDYYPVAEGDTVFLREIFEESFSRYPKALFDDELKRMMEEDNK